MIVPSRRLLVVGALTVVPLCTLAALLPTVSSTFMLLFVLLLIIVAGDAYLALASISKLSVRTAETLKLVRGRTAVLALSVRNDSGRTLSLRIAPDFPVSLQAGQRILSVASLAPHSEALSEVELSAAERGNVRVDGCSIESSAPLRLWLARRRVGLSLVVQVHPNLVANKVAAMFLRHTHSGLKTYRQVGQGREFEKLREYSPGDTFDQIYWKATARRGHPITKLFQIERAQQCYVLLDCSRQTAADRMLDYFVEATLVLGLAAQRFGDRFGILTFSDRVHTVEPAGAGKAQFGRCRNAVCALQPQPVSADFAELVAFTQRHLRKRALLFVLTSLADPYAAESLARHIRLLAMRHHVVIGALRRPLVNRIFDGPRPETLSGVYGALAGHFVWSRLREFGSTIQAMGADLALCGPDTIYADLTNRYRQVKQRQLL